VTGPVQCGRYTSTCRRPAERFFVPATNHGCPRALCAEHAGSGADGFILPMKEVTQEEWVVTSVIDA